MIEGRQARFDLALGRTRRNNVMREFEMRAKAWLDKADNMAQVIAAAKGTVTADDVTFAMGEPPSFVSPKARGAIFLRKHWERAGITQSKRPQNNASMIGVWRLRRDV